MCARHRRGIRADGRKGTRRAGDGYRESAGSWADLLRDPVHKRPREDARTVIAEGTARLGFWAALREGVPTDSRSRVLVSTRPATSCPRCPSSAPTPGEEREEEKGEREREEDEGEKRGRRRKKEGTRPRSGEPKRRPRARPRTGRCQTAYGGQVPKCVAKITDDLASGSGLYDTPTEQLGFPQNPAHQNPIESTFATVAQPPRSQRDPGSAPGGLAMGPAHRMDAPRPLARGHAPHSSN